MHVFSYSKLVWQIKQCFSKLEISLVDNNSLHFALVYTIILKYSFNIELIPLEYPQVIKKFNFPMTC